MANLRSSIAAATAMIALALGCSTEDDSPAGQAGAGGAAGAGGEAIGAVAGAHSEAGSAGAAGNEDPVSAGAGGGSAGSGNTGGEAPAVIGEFVDEWATEHTITEERWTQDSAYGASGFSISLWIDAERFLVAQNDSTNAYYPDLFSRFDWTEHAGDLWFCQIAYDAASESAAAATARPDDSDPATSGCGDFAWSRLTPVGGGGAGGAG